MAEVQDETAKGNDEMNLMLIGLIKEVGFDLSPKTISDLGEVGDDYAKTREANRREIALQSEHLRAQHEHRTLVSMNNERDKKCEILAKDPSLPQEVKDQLETLKAANDQLKEKNKDLGKKEFEYLETMAQAGAIEKEVFEKFVEDSSLVSRHADPNDEMPEYSDPDA